MRGLRQVEISSSSPAAERLVYLDLLRGLAALAVVAGHARAFVIVDFGAVTDPSIAVKLLYFVTGLGHQAVIAFFALSGYLVGGRVVRAMLHNRWSVRSYLIARLSRLWTVVVPALVLTLVLDLAGMALGGGDGYSGKYFDQLSSGPQPSLPTDHSLATFLGNLMFMQTVTVPVFGSNGPLWSLANEFWYYVVFPLAAGALLVKQSVWSRGAGLLTAAILAFLLPIELMLLGIIWIAGAVAFLASHYRRTRVLCASRLYLALSLGVAIAGFGVGLQESGVAADLCAGIGCAILLPALANLKSPSGVVGQLSLGLSEISYTLYAVHFPILALLYFVLMGPAQLAPDGAGLIYLGGLIVVCLACAGVLWWLFERNTHLVRAAVSRLLLPTRRSR